MISRILKTAITGAEYAAAYAYFWGPSGFRSRIRDGVDAGLTVVFYHEVGTNADVLGGVVIDVQTFRGQIAFLKQHYTPVSIDQVHDHFEGRVKLPPRAVLVTFDGGYAGNFVHAYPILKAYEVPAVIYVVTSCIEERSLPWPTRLAFLLRTARRQHARLQVRGAEIEVDVAGAARIARTTKAIKQALYPLPAAERDETLTELASRLQADDPAAKDFFLSWEQVRRMQDEGLVVIGSHTITHPRLSEVPLESALREIEESKTIIEERTGHPVTSFCFPDGRYDPEHVEAIKRAGYRSAVTTVNGINSPAACVFELRRYGGESHPIPLFAAKLAGVLTAVRRVVRGRPAFTAGAN